VFILPFQIALLSGYLLGKLCALEPCPPDLLKQLPKLLWLLSCDQCVALLMLLPLESSYLSLHVLVLRLSLRYLGRQLCQPLAL